MSILMSYGNHLMMLCSHIIEQYCRQTSRSKYAVAGGFGLSSALRQTVFTRRDKKPHERD